MSVFDRGHSPRGLFDGGHGPWLPGADALARIRYASRYGLLWLITMKHLELIV